MEPKFIGYGLPVYCIIGWKDEAGDYKHKTYCYDESDLNLMLARNKCAGDIYNSLVPVVHFI